MFDENEILIDGSFLSEDYDDVEFNYINEDYYNSEDEDYYNETSQFGY